MATLWIMVREDGAAAHWHHSVDRLEAGRYRMACGVELHLREAASLWPTKPSEIGPKEVDRCRACVSLLGASAASKPEGDSATADAPD